MQISAEDLQVGDGPKILMVNILVSPQKKRGLGIYMVVSRHTFKILSDQTMCAQSTYLQLTEARSELGRMHVFKPKHAGAVKVLFSAVGQHAYIPPQANGNQPVPDVC